MIVPGAVTRFNDDVFIVLAASGFKVWETNVNGNVAQRFVQLEQFVLAPTWIGWEPTYTPTW